MFIQTHTYMYVKHIYIIYNSRMISIQLICLVKLLQGDVILPEKKT